MNFCVTHFYAIYLQCDIQGTTLTASTLTAVLRGTSLPVRATATVSEWLLNQKTNIDVHDRWGSTVSPHPTFLPMNFALSNHDLIRFSGHRGQLMPIFKATRRSMMYDLFKIHGARIYCRCSFSIYKIRKLMKTSKSLVVLQHWATSSTWCLLERCLLRFSCSVAFNQHSPFVTECQSSCFPF